MNDMMRDVLDLVLGRRPPALQVGAICVQPKTGRVLLITSRDTGRWIIPKGWPMSGRSAANAALQEAWEEAGVRGKVEASSCGRYAYDKKQDNGLSIPVDVQVHIVNVDRLEADYPERHQRERQWFSPEKAAELVNEEGLKALLRSF